MKQITRHARRSRVFLLALGQLGVACNDDGATIDDADASTSSSTSSSHETMPSSAAESSSSGSSSGTTTDDAASSSGVVDDSSSSSSSDGVRNVPPSAVDDVFHTPADTMLAVDAIGGLLVNDHDPEGDVLSISDADAESQAGAVVAVAPDGSFTYTAAPGFWGPDRFGYTATDLEGAVTAAEVVINVTPVHVELADLLLDETHGFTIEGGANDRMLGTAVAGMGDVDGDGLGDLLLGAPYREYGTGGAYVVFGSADPTQVDVDAIVGGTGGYAMMNQVPSIASGVFTHPAGDVDSDGITDFVLGAYQDHANADFFEIRSYVVFGKNDTAAIDLDDVIDGVGGFTIAGDPQLDGSDPTMYADGVGDLDGDGHADIVIGAPAVAATGNSRTYVIYGSADTSAIDLADVGAGVGGYVIEGVPTVGAFSYRFASLGDVDGDGHGDLAIVDAYFDDRRGRTYVVLGDPAAATIDLADVASGSGGFVIDGAAADDGAGISIARAGDVDGDGLADLVISAPDVGFGVPGPGLVYVVFGKADNEGVALSDVAAGSGGFVIHGEVGSNLYGVGGGGDFDGDGHADLAMISRSTMDFDSPGRAYVVYGTADTGAIELADVVLGDGGFALDAEMLDVSNNLGAVGFAPDIDGDGLDELMVGDPNGTPTPNGEIPGRVYVVRGASRAPY